MIVQHQTSVDTFSWQAIKFPVKTYYGPVQKNGFSLENIVFFQFIIIRISLEIPSARCFSFLPKSWMIFDNFEIFAGFIDFLYLLPRS